jgi:hypothetical protein
MQPDYPAESFAGWLDMSGNSAIQIDSETEAWLSVSNTEVPGASVVAVFSAANSQIADLTIAGLISAADIGVSHLNGNTMLSLDKGT